VKKHDMITSPTPKKKHLKQTLHKRNLIPIFKMEIIFFKTFLKLSVVFKLVKV